MTFKTFLILGITPASNGEFQCMHSVAQYCQGWCGLWSWGGGAQCDIFYMGPKIPFSIKKTLKSLNKLIFISF